MAGKPNSKWLETMIKKHGSREAVTEVMRGIGAKGGKHPYGGFKYAKENGLNWHKEAGRKGGKKSKRGPVVH